MFGSVIVSIITKIPAPNLCFLISCPARGFSQHFPWSLKTYMYSLKTLKLVLRIQVLLLLGDASREGPLLSSLVHGNVDSM